MSVYSVKDDGRFRLCSVIFGCSLFLAIGINYYLNLVWTLTPDLILIQGAITISPTLICFLIIRHVPRSLFLLFHIPDINGEYSGILVSSFNECKQVPVKLIIKQQIFNISIVLKTESSDSINNTAYIEINDDGSISLTYTYQNKGCYMGTRLNSHTGTCNATIMSQKITARYYSDPDRKTYGILDLTKD